MMTYLVQNLAGIGTTDLIIRKFEYFVFGLIMPIHTSFWGYGGEYKGKQNFIFIRLEMH